MKFSIIIEDKKKGKIKIPLPKNKIRDLFDIMYIVDDSHALETIKLNNMEKTFYWFHKITDHLVFDIMDGGIFIEGSRANKRFKAVRMGRYYLTKKPRWKNQSTKSFSLR